MRYFSTTLKLAVMLALSLTMTACGGSSSSDTTIPTTPAPTPGNNNQPVANAGVDQVVGNGEVVMLSGAQSTDVDGNDLTYSWLLSTLPNDSTTTLSNTTSQQASFVVDATGTYVVSLTVNDGTIDSQTDTVTIIASAGKPNILLIIADDQGLDASAQYNLSSDLPNTPTINSLAANGIVFENAWATPACTTTRGSLITGKHGINSGISYVPATMDSNTQTLQRYMKSLSNSSDYQTAVIGKWHLGGSNPELTHPTQSGVDYYAGTIKGTIDNYYNWDLTENGQSDISSQYHTSKITDLAINWLDSQNTANKPWFMWLAYVAPHSPFHLPPESLHQRTHLTGTQEHINNNKRDYYLAAIEAMDSEIGRLLDSLPQSERDNTLILYIGDNGTPAAVIDTAVYSRSHSKGSLFEGGIRIPMVVSGHGVTRQNERETALVNTTDFYTTLSNYAGNSTTQLNDSYSFLSLLDSTNTSLREYNYSEFDSDNVTGWSVRNNEYKLIELVDGTQQLYKISEDLNESNDLINDSANADLVNELKMQANITRGEQSTSPLDITNVTLINRSGNCADYVESYQSNVMDIHNATLFNGHLQISVIAGKCLFKTNNIPNHDFNDGAQAFPNHVSAQDKNLEITAAPTHATTTTAVTLQTDNAILLNGVKVDLLAAACYGVGDGKTGCNNINQPWRYDPMFNANGFRVDSHNAHSQPSGAYHYHGKPNALFNDENNSTESPVIGFAADGYPIFGSYFNDDSITKKALSSFQLKSGDRPTGADNPGGTYNGTFRDDYQYVEGSGDLDECNGMTLNGVYGYYVTDGYPYILTCFKGTPDPSFNK